MRRIGRIGLTVSLLAPAIVVMGWFGGASASFAFPATVARQIALPASALAAGADLSVVGGDAVRAPALPTARSTSPTRDADVCAPILFTAVTVAWRQDGGVSPDALIRAGLDLAHLRPAVDVEDADAADRTSRDGASNVRAAGPLWVGAARCVRVRLLVPGGVTVRAVRVVFLNTSGTAGVPTPTTHLPAPAGSGAFGIFGPGRAEAMTDRPEMVGRAAWGADPSLKNCTPGVADRLKMAFVHHTATDTVYDASESDDIVRSIYYTHTQIRGFCDIAYNFLVDRYGVIFIGRSGGTETNVIPGSQMGFNTSTFSISAIGTFTADKPRAVMLDAIERTLAWRLDVAHVPALGHTRMTSAGGDNTRHPAGAVVSLPVISGHRRTGYTECPGDLLNGLLSEIRHAVDAIGLPKIIRPAQSPASITPGINTVRWTAKASQSLNWQIDVISDLDGSTVRTLTASGSDLDATWDGKGLLPFPVPAGTYTVQIRGSTLSGLARSAAFSLTVNATT